MKLKLMAAASHHTADFKVLAAEYRFAAEGLESLTPGLKDTLLNIVKGAKKEELDEMLKAITACKDKKGLEFIMAVLKEAQKSPILTQKAEQITNSIKPKNKTAIATESDPLDRDPKVDDINYDMLFPQQKETDGPITKVVNFIFKQGIKIGMILFFTGIIYAFSSLITEHFLGLPEGTIRDFKGILNVIPTGMVSMILGICVKLIGMKIKFWYPKA